MKKKEPAPPRKKACKQCTKGKLRCGLQRPCCSRCQSRNLPCNYLISGPQVLITSPNARVDAAESERSVTPGGYVFTSPAAEGDVFFDEETGQSLRQMIQSHNSEFRSRGDPCRQSQKTTYNSVDYSHIDLISVTDSASIRNRWLQSFLPTSGQRAKVLPPHTVQYLSCIFRSYSRQLLRPRCYPPFIHPLQMVDGEFPLSLANCFSLVRMWVGREHGSDVLIVETMRREMQRLFDEVGTHLLSLTRSLRSIIWRPLVSLFTPRLLSHLSLGWTLYSSSLTRSPFCTHIVIDAVLCFYARIRTTLTSANTAQNLPANGAPRRLPILPPLRHHRLLPPHFTQLSQNPTHRPHDHVQPARTRLLPLPLRPLLPRRSLHRTRRTRRSFPSLPPPSQLGVLARRIHKTARHLRHVPLRQRLQRPQPGSHVHRNRAG
jgi:hypothetical protein